MKSLMVKALVSIFLAFLFFQVSQAKSLAEPPPGYAVASAHPLATQAGMDILAQGGNAFDAAIAVGAVLAVVEPYHSGLGGGGFWLLYDAKKKKNIFLDGREVAPLAATEDMFLDKEGKPIKGKSLNGGLAAAIPGEPAAFAYLAKHYGRLPLTKSLAPAIKIAREGFPIDSHFLFFVLMEDRLQMLKKYPATAEIFLNQGKPYQPGEILRQEDLARSLELLAQKGHDGFYNGEVAKKLVSAVNAAGGIWSLEDLRRYKVKLRKPLEGAYHSMVIVTAPPPSQGGVILLKALSILESFPLNDIAKAKVIHYVVEALRLAYWQADQNIADPDVTKIPLLRLLSIEQAQYLRALISPTKATDSKSLMDMEPESQEKSPNTSHISILDKEGNRVSATMSINYIFGSSVVAAGTGILLNDEMDDFSIKPGEPNVFGLLGSKANAIAPGKRPMSSMTPTFLTMPGRLAILGSTGGSRIPSMMVLAALNFYDYLGAMSLVANPRFHHQYWPDQLVFEPNAFSPVIQEELKAMGYVLKPLHQYYGDMHAITWEKSLNVITAAADARHEGWGKSVLIEENQIGYGTMH